MERVNVVVELVVRCVSRGTRQGAVGDILVVEREEIGRCRCVVRWVSRRRRVLVEGLGGRGATVWFG